MKNEMIELTEAELEAVAAGGDMADRATIGSAAGATFGGLIGVNLLALGFVTGATIITGGGFLGLLAIGAAAGGAFGLMPARS
ncbi:MAG: hypothetical protein HYV95_12280 [Opitutae bacterium]|nr:hypothetical protein [Opitutae bacterium]